MTHIYIFVAGSCLLEEEVCMLTPNTMMIEQFLEETWNKPCKIVSLSVPT